MDDKKLTVGLLFGGKSTEHEVSVISALQAYENLDKDKYHVVPIYVSKAGLFFTNQKFLHLKNYKDVDSLLLSSKQIVLANKNGRGGFLTQGFFSKFTEIDVAFPIFHGSFGEDGTMQGLFEMYGIPYVGLNVVGSAVAMDKVSTKAIFSQLGLPIGKFVQIKRFDWISDQKQSLKYIQDELSFPLFVKPSSAGSSIGVNKAIDTDSLTFAIEVASAYSDKILIEEAFENCIEVNCSVLGYKEAFASICEMPIPSSDVLSFADKYQKGGSKGSKGSGGMASLSREIPAPISDSLAKQIQEATIKVFKALDGCGVIRVDYFVNKDKNKFWINEVNPMPGSLSFYLWNKTKNPFSKEGHLEYPELLDKLIEFALERAQDQKKTQHTFNSGLLSQMALSNGSKQ